jgi:hypothetical protein
MSRADEMTTPEALESKKNLHRPFITTFHGRSFEASVLLCRMEREKWS